MKGVDRDRSASISARWRLAALAVLAFPALSQAQTVVLSNFAPNPGVLPGGGWQFSANTNFGDPPPARAWTNGTYGSVPGVKAVDSLTLRGPAGPLAVQVARTASLASVGAVAARCLGNPVCMGAAGLGAALVDYWAQHRVKPAEGGSGGYHDPVYDAGQPQSEHTAALYSLPGQYASLGQMNNPAALGQVLQAVLNANDPEVSCTDRSDPERGNFQRQVRIFYQVETDGDYYRINTRSQRADDCSQTSTFTGNWQGFQKQVTTGQMCPPVVNFSDPRYSTPGGPAGADGKCPTGAYSPLSPDQAGQMFQSAPPADPAQMAKALMDTGLYPMPAEWAGTSGPASQIADPVTTVTTKPDGSTKTTTETATYDYSYGLSGIGWTKKTSTITNDAGAVTSTQTTSAPTPKPWEWTGSSGFIGGSQTSGDPSQASSDLCALHPEAAACASLGTVQPDALPREDRPISYVPEVFQSSATCPAPVSVSALGQSLELSFQPTCDAASAYMKPILLVLASVAAAFVFVGGLKS